ncbi:hypothetical protein E1265_07480 [Streptomyces sp. 8K308]|uniref:hypothetical protein n=1 Tax=Streptomyces sp. 8K308 TaxID=2530388 RepID=UPI001050FE82|nr:hypothetical protein [Streptomyces sp. 8K308]TDC25295.1 hypothetical protein E1265_07480 [Streptomyces sp. 8K308]
MTESRDGRAIDKEKCLTGAHISLDAFSEEGGEYSVSLGRLLRDRWSGAMLWVVLPAFFGVFVHWTIGVGLIAVSVLLFAVVFLYRIISGHGARCAAMGALSLVLSFDLL